MAAASAAGSVVHTFVSKHTTKINVRCRVIVAGESTVGKTALIKLAASRGSEYPKNYIMTTGVEVSERSFKIADAADLPDASTSLQVDMQLLDMPGSIIFNQREDGSRLWGSTHLVAGVFDIGNRESFTALPKWLRRVQDAYMATTDTSRPVQGVIIGNKADLREGGGVRAAVSTEEATAFATSLGLAYFEVSAENLKDYDKPFEHVARSVYTAYTAELAKMSSA